MNRFDEGHAADRDGGSARGQRFVLVVDDDQDMCLLVSEALLDAGYDVTCLDNGRAALAAVRRQRPDLVLLDVHMPGISGWDVLDELRSAAGPQQAIVVMTAAYQGQQRALASGAQGYLAKPFGLGDLLACVELHAGLPIANGQEAPLAHDQLAEVGAP
jgi:CheY-like chemotaxis protein